MGFVYGCAEERVAYNFSGCRESDVSLNLLCLGRERTDRNFDLVEDCAYAKFDHR
jgi:hypothetical protein